MKIKTFIVVANIGDIKSFSKEFEETCKIEFSPMQDQFNEYIGVVDKVLTIKEEKQVKDIATTLAKKYPLENYLCASTIVALRPSSERNPSTSPVTKAIEASVPEKYIMSFHTDGIDSAHILRGNNIPRKVIADFKAALTKHAPSHIYIPKTLSVSIITSKELSPRELTR